MSWSSVEDFSRPCPRDGYYDVFISFRGIDTRSGFTDNLYHSLLESKMYTFIDVDLAGNVIETLFKIIETSRIAVVVYSESFASSDWCLRELEMIMQRWEEKKMLMIPIFYKVAAHELKHPTEKTRKYFDEHIIKYGELVVRKWKDAVTKIGNVSGFPYTDVYSRSERDFIKFVTAQIKKKLGDLLQRETGLESSTSKPYYNKGPAMENHDVFISFLGEDMHYGLVTHLYDALIVNEIKTFMHNGDYFTEADIFEVIQRSKMSIIVFSPNYATSKWCLTELVKILQCGNTMGQVVLPIFYQVRSSDLINQEAKGSRIAYHLKKHASYYEEDAVQSWRNAITDLGNVDGFHFSASHGRQAELEFIRGLVGKISTILNRLHEKKVSSGNQDSHGLTIEEKKQALAVQTDGEAFARIVWAMRKTEEMSLYDAAATIQKNFRAHLIRKSQSLRAHRELAVAKAKLKEIRRQCNKFSYRSRFIIDTTERQRLAEEITVLLRTVHDVEGVYVLVRAVKKSMVGELEAMLNVVDPQPPGKSLPREEEDSSPSEAA